MAAVLNKTNPWYRQPWPWFLMALPAIAVVAGSYTAWLAVKTNDGLVVDDYYKEGLAVSKVVGRSEHAASLGLTAQVKMVAGRVWVRLEESGGAAAAHTVLMTISHPTRAGLDQHLVMHGTGGVFAAEIPPLGAGRWDLALEDELRTWRLNGALHLPTETDVTMHPYALKPVD